MDTLKVFVHDFNDPSGSFIIKNSPDFNRESNVPVVGEWVILVSLDSRVWKWDEDYNNEEKNVYDAGIGVVVKVVSVTEDTGVYSEYHLIGTDYYERIYGNK